MALKLVQQHELLVKQLETLALEGALNPLNRSPRWPYKLAVQALEVVLAFETILILNPVLLHI